MCRPSQASHPRVPRTTRPLRNSVMAARRPMVAMIPLSLYRNGWGSGRQPAEDLAGGMPPDWIATWATFGQTWSGCRRPGPTSTAAASPMA